MAIDMDDEILQDFLVEAGEILELLGEQLVELEQSPEDLDLLNAIFRGFHTVKGGAGFLGINPLVDVCHKAEDVFNVLRQGDRKATPELMDEFLRVLDVVNVMFDCVRSGQEPGPADPSLLDTLQRFASADAAAPTEPVSVENEAVAEEPIADSDPVASAAATEADVLESATESVMTASAADAMTQEFDQMLGPVDAEPVVEPSATAAQTANDEITEDEFEELLDALHGKGESPTPQESSNTLADNNQVPADDEISEAEFDQLLDELHGEGKFTQSGNAKENSAVSTANNDEISEEEFQAVLDEIHGEGKFSGKAQVVEEPQTAQPVNKEADVVKENSEIKPAATKEVKEKPKKSATVSPIKPEKKPQKQAAQAETTVRVDTQILDDMMNMVGELVLVRNRFQTLRASGGEEEISKAVSNLDVVTADLQLAVMKTRMQPIKKVFGRFPRVVRDLARSLNKEIKLELVGEDTDLDKNLVEALADPLVHLVRNAVDHGIESPEDRIAVGKPREGTVILSASQEGDHIQLLIEDNGKGMNADVLRKMAVEKGLMDEESASRLEDKECFNLIFAPGFSTKKEISDVSGRGVGMDVVKTRIAQMNGTVEIDSSEGKGSTIIIKVPLTLAIMPTLMVKLGIDQAFALPLSNVLEILDLDLRHTNVVDGQLVVMVRDRALPLFYLSKWLINDPNYITETDTTGHVVVVNAGGRQIGFVVDQLIGQEEVVIKPLGAKLQGVEGLAGATITGDGKIALILDVPELIKRYAA